ncbi:MAG: hypothetical protein I8H76_12145 [Burkholderiales bacterium]|nr:hypothetical protein [Burkholderiales bacterium]MBH2015321.1 hypothetical protein [Burkholderiales bacterium]
MSDKTLQRLPLALAALLACASAHADFTSADGKARLSGFGTLGVSRTNTDEALFNYPGQGGGVDKQMGLEPDTKFGVQGSYKFTDTISGTAQVLTKYRAIGQYQPEFEWAFAKWQALPSLSVRGGRIGAPYFMISDFRDVGYANTAIRPPLDVYGQVPVSSFDGADVSYQTELLGASVTSTLWGGNSRAEFSSSLRSAGTAVDPSVIKIKNSLGVNLQAELDNGLTVRLGHAGGALSVESTVADQLIAGARANFGGAAPNDVAAIASTLTTEGVRASFTGIGLAYDHNNVVLATEFTKRKVKKGYIPSTTGWYVLGGYRFGNILPYLIVSKIKVDDPNATMPSTPTVSAVAGGGNAGARNLLGGMQAVLNSQKLEQRTLSVGARWDISRSLALKAQFDRVTKPSGSNGLFLVPDLGADLARGNASFLNTKKNINVISLAVDFVF